MVIATANANLIRGFIFLESPGSQLQFVGAALLSGGWSTQNVKVIQLYFEVVLRLKN